VCPGVCCTTIAPIAIGVKQTYAAGLKALASFYEGHLRGLPEPAQAGLVMPAARFSAVAGGR
jgi:hypothetical protein